MGLVIGKAGGTIKGIQGRTSSNIQIPPMPDQDDPSRRTISITAPSRHMIELAMREIQNVIDAGAMPGMAPVNVPGNNTVIMQASDDVSLAVPCSQWPYMSQTLSWPCCCCHLICVLPA